MPRRFPNRQTVAPFNVAAFQLEIAFGEKYPFEPPKLRFKTPIYHPNVDDKGSLCFDTINPANWKPATKLSQVCRFVYVDVCTFFTLFYNHAFYVHIPTKNKRNRCWRAL